MAYLLNDPSINQHPKTQAILAIASGDVLHALAVERILLSATDNLIARAIAAEFVRVPGEVRS